MFIAQNYTLNTPVTVEMVVVIKALSAHKSLGPDGLPYVYYKTVSPISSPPTVFVFFLAQRFHPMFTVSTRILNCNP